MFITAKTIRRLIDKGRPPLVTCYDPSIPEPELAPEDLERLQAQQQSLSSRYIEGSCFDLSLARVEVKRNHIDVAFVGVDSRLTPETKLLPFARGNTWQLIPGRSYQLVSAEYINCPKWLMPIVHSRMTILQSQAITQFTFVKPGYSGTICGEIQVVEGALDISRGARFCSVAFSLFASDAYVELHQSHDALRFSAEAVSKETDPYRGNRGGDIHGTQGTVWGPE